MDRDRNPVTQTPSVPLASRGKGQRKIAVNIALIPPKEIIQFAIELNRSFPETIEEDYVLDAETCMPHITVLMGLISPDTVLEVNARLESIVQKFSPLSLRITGGSTFPHPDGKMFSSFVLEKTPHLQKFHETVIEEVGPLFSWEGVETKMFYSPPPVKKISSYWVKGFAKTSVRENYKPHISLGFGELTRAFESVQFTASTVALCHQGNYCTCRKIINSFPLIYKGDSRGLLL